MTELIKRIEPIPQQLGPYRLLRRLGAGAAAQVWLGKKDGPSGGKLVALKITPRNALGYGRRRRMFENEARVSTLRHANIVQVFDVAEIDGHGVLVMEWVDGVDLAVLLDCCRRAQIVFSIELATYIVGEVLTGLAYAHALIGDRTGAAIVHRDLSPHNVIVSTSGEVKIADFGIARLSDEQSSGLHIVGKPRYMAPEHAMGHSSSPSVDLFAVGAILFELVEGDRFRAGSEGEELLAVARAGSYCPRKRELPTEIAQLCDALLEPDPAARVRSATDALDLLGRWPGVRESSEDLSALVRRFTSQQGEPGTRRSDLLAGDVSSDSAISIPGTGSGSAQQQRQRWPRWVPLVLGLAVACGYVVVGGGRLEWGDSDPNTNQLAQPSDASSEGSLVPPMFADFGYVVPAPPVVTGASPAVSPPPPPDTDEGTVAPGKQSQIRRPHSRKHARPVAPPHMGSVEFFAHEYQYLEIEIAGRRLELDPSDRAEVPVGKHAVRFREPPGPWLDGGFVEVEHDRVIRVRFKRPGAMAIHAVE